MCRFAYYNSKPLCPSTNELSTLNLGAPSQTATQLALCVSLPIYGRAYNSTPTAGDCNQLGSMLPGLGPGHPKCLQDELAHLRFKTRM